MIARVVVLTPNELAALVEAAVARALAAGAAPAKSDFVDARGSGLDRASFRRAARELGAPRIGRKLIIRRADLDSWIEGHRARACDTKPTPDASDDYGEDALDRAIANGSVIRLRGGSR